MKHIIEILVSSVCRAGTQLHQRARKAVKIGLEIFTQLFGGTLTLSEEWYESVYKTLVSLHCHFLNKYFQVPVKKGIERKSTLSTQSDISIPQDDQIQYTKYTYMSGLFMLSSSSLQMEGLGCLQNTLLRHHRTNL